MYLRGNDLSHNGFPVDEPGNKCGHLYRDFRVLHLRDPNGSHSENHYHDFYKILFLVSGSGNYTVRGLSYQLLPGDIVLVGANDAHMPDIPPGKIYDRILFFISEDFLCKYSTDLCDLRSIFSGVHGYVMRCDPNTAQSLLDMARLSMVAAEAADQAASGEAAARDAAIRETAMRDAAARAGNPPPGFRESEVYGASVLAHTELIRLLVRLGQEQARSAEASPLPMETLSGKVLRYIDAHYTEELSIDLLAEYFFISKYHLMRSFRRDVGTTIHAYISDCRLLMARALIRNGESSTNACFRSGFGSYSAFARAYVAFFGVSPGKYQAKESDRPL